MTARPETLAALIAMWEANGLPRAEAERLAAEQMDPERMRALREADAERQRSRPGGDA